MKITIECPDPAPTEIMRAVADMMSRVSPPATVATDAEWTVDRAVKMLRDTNARTLLFVSAAVENGGWIDGDTYRERWGREIAFFGPSQSITKAIKRGAEQELWSADINRAFTPTTPDKSGWVKTGGYYLAEEHEAQKSRIPRPAKSARSPAAAPPAAASPP